MMRFKTLINHPADWIIGAGAQHPVVITSRIRLARNLRQFSFPGWATKQERIELLDLVQPSLENLSVMKEAFSQSMNQLSALQKQVLVERHLISREQAARGEGSAAVISRDQSVSIMVNEEDHLRIQSIVSGFHLHEAHQKIADLDQELEEILPFAFDREWGYLTACPTNLGTGMRASVMLHLPGLVLSQQIGQALNAASHLRLAVRGLYGEGTESLANLFQISNQSTLGESEETIIESLERFIKQVVDAEMSARERLLKEELPLVLDHVGRAYGILTHAHVLSSKEALSHLSMLRFAADLDFLPETAKSICDALLMKIQPAHLQMQTDDELDPSQRDHIRAEIVRAQLQSLGSPVKDNGDRSSNDPFLI